MDMLSGLALLAEDYTRMLYRAQQAEAKLGELRMHLHQFVACHGQAKEDARRLLLADARDYHESFFAEVVGS